MSEQKWLESALSRELGKVEAPAELWERIQKPVAIRRETGGRPLAWVFAAVLFLVAGALGLRVRESHAAGPAELRSADATLIRNWVRSNTGLDLALPEVLGSSIHLEGARVVNPAAPSVEVSYQAGGREATLLVARAAGSSGIRHADLRAVSNDGKITWIMNGQVYTLSSAGPEEARVACLLCHAS